MFRPANPSAERLARMPSLDPPAIRKVVYTANAIESLNDSLL